MFNTFVGISNSESAQNPTERRRSIVTKACVECRRRKTKCVGTQPCTSCLACNVECVFPEFRRRGRKSQKATANATPIGDYEAVVKLIFPNTSIKTLKNLSRANLLEQAQLESDFTPGTSNQSSSVTSPDIALNHQVRYMPDSDANDRLYRLQYQDSSIVRLNEASTQCQPSVEDDVNALSMTEHSSSFFVGISSVTAAIRALTEILPIRIDKISMPEKEKFEPVANRPAILPSSIGPICSYREEQRLIDAYFAGIHVFVPIIHEPSFRSRYLAHHGNDDQSWLALLNIVLALGSIISSPWDSEDDLQYFYLAQRYLSLDSFGSGRLETLQALLLMGGQYLHYRNRPNMASAILGACYRIAGALGLHLQRPGGSDGVVCPQEEIKRRSWWAVYILDTWGSVSLGRPSIAHGTAVELPHNILDDQGEILSLTEPTIYSPLIHNIQLCRIMNRIQDRLLINSIMADDELQHYDKLLLSWFDSLPPFLHSVDICPSDLQDARTVLKWRYQNIRFLLYRPILLDTVIRNVSFDDLTLKERTAVSKCRDIAMEAIYDIQSEWRPNKISCLNAVEFLFQACLIPLMAIAVESKDSSDYQSWCNQVQTGIDVCSEMSQFNPAGPRTKEFLSQLFVTVLSSTTEPFDRQMSVEDRPPVDTLMGLFAGEWDQLNQYDILGQISTSDNSYLDQQVLDQVYFPNDI